MVAEIATHAMVAVKSMALDLYEHQKKAIDELKSGSILCGGVGSGKSRTALGYYYLKVCEGKLKINGKGGYSPMKKPRDLYIITTAKKRDTLDWEREIGPFHLSTRQDLNPGKVKVVVDSWNNIGKYKEVTNSFFIFDEQRLVGSGAWVKAFYKIAKPKQLNKWILLSATPGDTWMDYIPVFIANGFYSNRTEFIRRHVVYNMFTKYPKIDHYVECSRLVKLKAHILVNMEYQKATIAHDEYVIVGYDKESYKKVVVDRWNIFENRPIKNVSELCYLMRKVVNSSQERIDKCKELIIKHDRLIIFYNFDYELEILRNICKELNCVYAEYNGHKHEECPTGSEWVYILQYQSASEAWECITTDVMLLYSQNYSYKITTQAKGRIDRNNTPYTHLYYYVLKSTAVIDLAISKAYFEKRDFNEDRFMDI